MGSPTRTAVPDRAAPPRMASYVQERARSSIEAPERFNAVVQIVERWAAEGARHAGCRHYPAVRGRPGSMGRPMPGYDMDVLDGPGGPRPTARSPT
jgi:hypothetical protein